LLIATSFLIGNNNAFSVSNLFLWRLVFTTTKNFVRLMENQFVLFLICFKRIIFKIPKHQQWQKANQHPQTSPVLLENLPAAGEATILRLQSPKASKFIKGHLRPFLCFR
jgi:hypothetical protein